MTQTSRHRAEELARRWQAHGVLTPEALNGVKVVVSDAAIGLGFQDPKRGKPYYVDFLSAAWRARILSGLPRRHIFRRALGVRDEPVQILDATAGFGQDAMMALTLGCEVTALEQSNVVFTLLEDGVERARAEDETLRNQLSRLHLVEANATAFLSHNFSDVVYLDPMFDKPKKSAKSPKEMQLLQDLLPPPSANELQELFDSAMASARQRVVVKRPLKAKALGSTPNQMIKGQSIRYDIYLR